MNTTLQKSDQDTLAVLGQESMTLLEKAKAIIISNDEQFQAMAAFSRGIRALQKKISEPFDRITEEAKETKRAAQSTINTANEEKEKLLAPTKQAEAIVDGKLIEYQELETKRRQEEARIAQEAAFKAQQDAKLAAAVQADQNGNQKLATAILEAKSPTVAIRAQEAPKAAGLGIATYYSAELVDFDALLTAIIEDIKTPESESRGLKQLISFNQVAANGLARALKTQFNVPGVRLVETKGMVKR